MLKERNIAFFIDLFNTELSTQHYNNILSQLENMGQIISGTIYGAAERNHKEVLAQADARGYNVVRGARKRGRKVFDNRIIVDVVDKINHSRGIDTVCIVALPADMVYLYAYLRERGIKVVSLNNGDENTMALVDETVDSGKVETIKLPKAPAKPKAEPVVAPVVEAPVVAEPVVAPAQPAPAPSVSDEVSRMDQLLKEIERLRSEAEKAPQPVVAIPEEPVVEEPVAPAPVESVAEEPVVAPVEPAPVEQPAEAPAQPRASYESQDDADLLRRIEEMRKASGSHDELIDEIKKLLDDID